MYNTEKKSRKLGKEKTADINPLKKLFANKYELDDNDRDDGGSKAEQIAVDTFARQHEINKRKKRQHLAITTLFAAVVCLIFAVACIALFFNVENIKIEGNNFYDSETILKSSGIQLKQNLYAIDKAEIENSIIMECPYIKSVRIKRNIPTALTLVIEEETAVYYFEYLGEYFALSDDLRVIECTDDVSDILIRYTDIIKINTQQINYAVAGSKLVFQNDSYFTYAHEMLKTMLGSDIGDKITLIDFSDKFNIFVMYEDRFQIEFGNSEDLDLKIRIAVKIINRFDKNDSGIINVESKEAFVILKGQKIFANVNNN